MEQEDLVQVLESLWHSLAMPDELRPPRAPFDGTSLDYTACVDVMGCVDGVVTFECDRGLARVLAARMFELPESGLEDADVLDALREVANLLGGNVKGLIGQHCAISLPRAAPGSEAFFENSRQKLLGESAFESGGQRLRVRVTVEGER